MKREKKLVKLTKTSMYIVQLVKVMNIVKLRNLTLKGNTVELVSLVKEVIIVIVFTAL